MQGGLRSWRPPHLSDTRPGMSSIVVLVFTFVPANSVIVGMLLDKYEDEEDSGRADALMKIAERCIIKKA
jgi:hypothetical protein